MPAGFHVTVLSKYEKTLGLHPVVTLNSKIQSVQLSNRQIHVQGYQQKHNFNELCLKI